MTQTGPEEQDAAERERGRTDDEPTVALPGNQELAKLREERDACEQKLQRQLADAANMRRRHRQELDDNKRRVIEALAQELLPVLDSFDQALLAVGTAPTGDAKSLAEGVRMTRMLLAAALERHGVREIAAVGVPFDPALHEAVAVEPTGDVPEGQIVRVLQTGYQLADRVVRHSRVVVAGPKRN